MSAGLEARTRARLAELDAAGLTRTLHAPAGVDFSSNDYLGLADHPLVVGRMRDALAIDGCGSTGSRLLRGHRDAFDRLERTFAAFKGTERALYFSSGYLANLAVLTAMTERGDLVLSDRLNHASLRDGLRLSPAKKIVFSHANVSALARLLEQHRDARQILVVTESLFSMDGDTAPLAAYAGLCRQAGAALIVDEAHAVGIYGRRGAGLIEATGTSADVTLSIDTAGKALGVAGAFVAGPAWAIDYLVQRARPFVFSTAPPPSLAAAVAASLSLIEREPGRRFHLRELAPYQRARLADAGVAGAPGVSLIVPVVVGESGRAVQVADALRRQGFDVRAIRPPTVPAGTARLRLSVNVRLTEAAIDRAVVALAAALQEPTPATASN